MAERPDEENWRGKPEDPRAMQPVLPTFTDPDKATGDNEEEMPEEEIPPSTEERRTEARDALRKRFPELRDEDLDEVSRQKTETSKFEVFIQKLMEKYKWSRGACHQQIDMGAGQDIRDC